MKRKIAALVVFIAIAVMSISGTMAYFTADSVATNVITAGNIDITLEEWQVENEIPFPEKGLEGVMPGDNIAKIVKVRNDGDYPAYIRVLVDKKVELADRTATDNESDLISIDFNTADWTYQYDETEGVGFYYYNSPLEAGAATVPLFTTVSFSTEMGNVFQNSKVQIDVKAYAVQVKNNGKTVLDAAGWPAVE